MSLIDAVLNDPKPTRLVAFIYKPVVIQWIRRDGSIVKEQTIEPPPDEAA